MVRWPKPVASKLKNKILMCLAEKKLLLSFNKVLRGWDSTGRCLSRKRRKLWKLRLKRVCPNLHIKSRRIRDQLNVNIY